MNIKMVLFIVGLLSYIMLSIIIFVFCSRILKRRNTKKLVEANEEINPLIDKQIENIKLNEKVDKEVISQIDEKINKQIYLDVFNDKIIELRNKREDKEVVNIFLESFRKRFVQWSYVNILDTKSQNFLSCTSS